MDKKGSNCFEESIQNRKHFISVVLKLLALELLEDCTSGQINQNLCG